MPTTTGSVRKQSPDINWKLVSEEVEDNIRVFNTPQKNGFVPIDQIPSGELDPLNALIQKELDSIHEISVLKRAKKINAIRKERLGKETAVSPYVKIENLPIHIGMGKQRALFSK